MPSLLIFFLLFLLPFIIAPFGVTQFENPKVIFAEVGVIILFLLVLCENKISFHKQTTQLSLYSAIVLLTFIDLFFFKTNLSFFGNAFRLQGVFLLWLLLLFSLLSASISLPRMPWFIFISLLFIETIMTFFLPLTASHRYVGTLGEPNALAAFVIFLFPFGWFALKHHNGEFAWKLFLLVFVVGILCIASSRSGMIAFGIELVFLVLQKFQLSLKKTTIICFMLYLLSYGLPFFEHTPYENRVDIWQSALYAGLLAPAVGNGFGNIEIVLHNVATGLQLPIQYYSVDSSHNIFLDWWVQGGVIGVSVLFFLVYFSLINFIQQQKKLALVLLFGLLTVLSFNPASVVGLLGFWWVIGQGFHHH